MEQSRYGTRMVNKHIETLQGCGSPEHRTYSTLQRKVFRRISLLQPYSYVCYLCRENRRYRCAHKCEFECSFPVYLSNGLLIGAANIRQVWANCINTRY